MDIFSKDNLSPRERITKWVNIKENIGDSISGTFLGYWEVPPKDGFKPQLALAIAQKDSEEVCGINVTDVSYMRSNIETTLVGDLIGLRYERDVDTGKPQKAKVIVFYNLSRKEREKNGVKTEIQKPLSTPNNDTDDTLSDFNQEF